MARSSCPPQGNGGKERILQDKIRECDASGSRLGLARRGEHMLEVLARTPVCGMIRSHGGSRRSSAAQWGGLETTAGEQDSEDPLERVKRHHLKAVVAGGGHGQHMQSPRLLG